MGIPPSNLVDLTPYELMLMKEGYQRKLNDEWEIAKFIAYANYATVSAANGVEPKPIDQWLKPEESTDDPDKPIGDAREVDAAYKAEMEAWMNSI